MSSSTAIAAVTELLRQIIKDELGDLDVTTLPPDRSKNPSPKSPLNLFLYHLATNSAMKNQFSTHAAPRTGELLNTAPLALNLHYLLSANVSEDERESQSQAWLGLAMNALHSRPIIDRKLITQSEVDLVRRSRLEEQIERVRISLHPLSLDDMYKIWSGFQCPFRLSVAYEVSVVLLDPLLPKSSAAPVLRRGEIDRGPIVTSSGDRRPIIESIIFPTRAKTTRGDFAPSMLQLQSKGSVETITLVGRNLSTENPSVEFQAVRNQKVVKCTPTPTGDDVQVSVKWTDDEWHPGLYMVTYTGTQTEPKPGRESDSSPGLGRVRSNSLPLAIAPYIDPTILSVKRTDSSITVGIKIAPAPVVGQTLTCNVTLLDAGPTLTSSYALSADNKPANSLYEFSFQNVPGNFAVGARVRVRVSVDDIENISIAQAQTKDGNDIVTFSGDYDKAIT